ncbi:MAG: glycosyltransferase [Oscillospiraceae bacterium]|nr:glycosyltransferase [Oscillospiraceae bacterium]
MKILIVSHNVLSLTSNMGRTMMSYFAGMTDVEIAQFYISSEMPVDNTICRNYYRFTDGDAICSLAPFGTYGSAAAPMEAQPEYVSARTDSGLISTVYRVGAKRTALIYTARNLLWKLSRWDTAQYWRWVEDFAPDVIFFASGDYGFMYDIARKTAEYVKKPLAVACVDDYYLHNRNGNSPLGRVEHRLFLKTVHRTMARAQEIFTICQEMKREYETLFQINCCVLHTAASVPAEAVTNICSGQIAYLGNLGLGRAENLKRIGRTLKHMGRYLDVYSGERDPKLWRELTVENGVRFHGAVSAVQARRILTSSLVVIHTESFEERYRKITRYSVSTKIADSLMYGPCILAYGPEGIASVDYLKAHRAAYVVSDPDGLESGLKELLSSQSLGQSIVENARILAKQNHDPQSNPEKLKMQLEVLCAQWEPQ